MSRWTDLAEWRGPTANHGGPMLEQRGLVIHIAEGGYEGTIAWQKNPAAQVSSHFVTDHDGTTAQVVDTDVTAWTQQAGNGHWLSVENAGFTPGALSVAQCEATAQLFARGHRQYGWPLQLANGSSGRGLGHHSMGGTAWGHLDCPGPAIIAQKPAILARAVEIINGTLEDDMTPAQANILEATDNRVRSALILGTDTFNDVPGAGPAQSVWIVHQLNAMAADIAAIKAALSGGAGGLIPHEHAVPAGTTGPAVEA